MYPYIEVTEDRDTSAVLADGRLVAEVVHHARREAHVGWEATYHDSLADATCHASRETAIYAAREIVTSALRRREDSESLRRQRAAELDDYGESSVSWTEIEAGQRCPAN